MKAFLIGLLQAISVLALLLAILTLGGCATGVQMSDEERVACRSEGCVVYTEGELRDLTERAAQFGYRKGWMDATRQGSTGL